MLDSRKRLLCLAIISLLLSACAIQPNKSVDDAASLKVAISEANEAYKSGQADKALTLYKGAASAFPADKAPWLRMAQIKFDAANYGDAIVNALEALQRDPNDKVANSIVAVSGLRLSTKSLSVLRSQNDLTGSMRTEAQDLAKVLRESIGETVLIPSPDKPITKPVSKAKVSSHSTRQVSKPKAVAQPDVGDKKNDAGSSNPFGALK